MKAKKIICFILAVMLTFQTAAETGAAVYVRAAENDLSNSSTEQQSVPELTAGELEANAVPEDGKTEGTAKIVAELADRREQSVKHFRLEDGNYSAVLYPYPVHYLENGEYKDIDNTLVKKEAEDGKVYFTNTANDLKVKLPEVMEANTAVTVLRDKHSLSFLPVNTGKKAVNGTLRQASVRNSGVDDISVPEKLSAGVTYSGIADNISLRYDVQSNKLKESIILNKYTTDTFTFNISCDSLIAVLQNDNSVLFLENGKTEPVFTFEAPYMLDSSGEISSVITVSLTEISGGFRYTLTADKTWLTDSSRVYPVTVDPTVVTSTSRAQISATQVYSRYPTRNYGIADVLYSGSSLANGSTYEYRSYVQFTMPTAITSSQRVVSAKMYMKYYPAFNVHTGPTYTSLYRVTRSWDETVMTWDTKAGFENKIIDYSLSDKTKTEQYDKYDITKLVQGWTQGTYNNYGVMLKCNDLNTSADGNVCYYSEDINTGVEMDRPYAVITYCDATGTEPYWSYHSSCAGQAGTGYVNDFNGELTWLHSDIADSGSRMPVSVNHVYNGSRAGKVFTGTNRASNATAVTGLQVGFGFQLNLFQRIDQNPILSLRDDYPYVYLDGDGTLHYFINTATNEWKDEDGLGYTLTINSSCPVLTDKNGNTMTFTSSGYLWKVTDTNNQTLIVSYDGAYLSKTTDASGRINNFTRNSSGYLTAITSCDGKVTTFTYTGNYLTRITYPDATYSSYSYDSSGRLIQASSPDGTKTVYTYNSNGRVTVVTEKNKAGTAGEALTISYSNDNTTHFTLNGVSELSHFDNYGRTVNVVDKNGGASMSYCAPNQNTHPAKNKINTSSVYTKASENLLVNHSFESTGSWYASVWSGTTNPTFATDTSVSYLGNKSLRADQTGTSRVGHRQTVYVTAGETYTFSAYMKTENVSANGAGLYIALYNSEGTHVSTVEGDRIYGTTDWQRLHVTFTVPSGITRMDVYGGLCYSSGTVWMDCAQLEKSSTMNEYNMLENPTITSGREWTLYGYEGNAYWQTLGCLGVEGTQNKNVGLYQSIYVNKTGSVALNFGGKARADSVPMTGGSRYFAMDLYVMYTDGTYKSYVASFNPDTGMVYYGNGEYNWQYINKSVLTDPAKNVSHVTLYMIYYRNANQAFFDDLWLYADEGGTTYTYDNNGNVVSAGDYAKRNETYTYSTANELTNTVNPGSEAYRYFYASNNAHRLTSARSQQRGNGFAYSYDAYGNIASSSLGTLSGSGVLNTSAAYISGATSYNTGAYPGNYAASTTDSRGAVTSYSINPVNGLLNSVTSPLNVTTSYSYNSSNYLLNSVQTGSASNNAKVSYTYNTDKRLTAIQTSTTSNGTASNGTQYQLSYDSFGRRTITSIGAVRYLSTISYLRNGANSPVRTVQYDNQDYVVYLYDEFDRVTDVYGETGDLAVYDYNNAGLLGRVTDTAAGGTVKTDYTYDLLGRLTYSARTGTVANKFRYSYDVMNRPTGIYMLDGTAYTGSSFTYGSDSLLTYILLNQTGYDFAYDSLNRLTSERTVNNNVRADYTYVAGNGTNKTTELINTITYSCLGTTNGSLTYTYDSNGNILSVRDNNNKTISYAYDYLGQLTRVNDQKNNVTTVYAYGTGGNITQKSTYAYTTGTLGTATSAVNYTYGNSTWKDLLTACNGTSISYDAIGNPLNWRGMTNLTWQRGRQLASLQNGSTAVSYAYDSDGLRAKKTVGSTVTSFVYNDLGLLAKQTTGSNKLVFLYDNAGTVKAMEYNGTRYFTRRNAQGDVIALLLESGAVVANYSYDAWGKLLSVTDASGTAITSSSHIGNVNPIRYRGYYYDTETGFYSLQSRYYDPEIGRFISPDDSDTVTATPTELTDKNLFAYCDNNPVMREDKGGHFWNIIAGAVGGALIGGGIQVVSNLVSGNKWSDGLGTAMLTGAASGALAATGVGLLGSIAGNAAISMAGNTTNQLIKNKGFNNFDVGDMLIDGAIGGVAGAIGGRGMGKSANISTLNKNLTKKVLSGSSKVAIKGAKYYVSQTGKIYWRYLAKPILKSGGAGLLGSTSKAILSR